MKFDLRLIAIFTMLIDHIGLFYFPDVLFYRLIGRISFPLFAWGIASGAVHSQNIQKYAKRLLLAACISQLPWYLAGTVSPIPFSSLNVIFTLLFGLISILVWRSNQNFLFKFGAIYLLLYLAVFLDMDYQAIGVLSVLFSYIFYGNFPALLTSQIFLFSSIYLIALFLSLFGYSASVSSYLNLFTPFAFLLILLPRSSSRPNLRYLFYLVYPLQYLFFFIIKKYAHF